jgi:ABC-type Fe3+/spermidine/putrescine transport system ATPase subunit
MESWLIGRKTSLLKCIAELTVYQAGEILLNGKYVDPLPQ